MASQHASCDAQAEPQGRAGLGTGQIGAPANSNNRRQRQRSTTPPDKQWQQLQARLAGQVESLSQLLQQQAAENQRLRCKLRWLESGLSVLEQEHRSLAGYTVSTPSAGPVAIAIAQHLDDGAATPTPAPERHQLPPIHDPGAEDEDDDRLLVPSRSEPSPPFALWTLPSPGSWDRTWDARVQSLSTLDLLLLHREWIQRMAMLLPRAQCCGYGSPEQRKLLTLMDRYAWFDQHAMVLAPDAWAARSLYDLETLTPVQRPSLEFFQHSFQQRGGHQRTAAHFHTYAALSQPLRADLCELSRRFAQLLAAQGLPAHAPPASAGMLHTSHTSGRSASHAGISAAAYSYPSHPAVDAGVQNDGAAPGGATGGLSGRGHSGGGSGDGGTSGDGAMRPAGISLGSAGAAASVGAGARSLAGGQRPQHSGLGGHTGGGSVPPNYDAAAARETPVVTTLPAGRPGSSVLPPERGTVGRQLQYCFSTALDECLARLQRNLWRQRLALRQVLHAAWHGLREEHCMDVARSYLTTYPLPLDDADYLDALSGGGVRHVSSPASGDGSAVPLLSGGGGSDGEADPMRSTVTRARPLLSVKPP